jgi:hypothetical protein
MGETSTFKNEFGKYIEISVELIPGRLETINNRPVVVDNLSVAIKGEERVSDITVTIREAVQLHRVLGRYLSDAKVLKK